MSQQHVNDPDTSNGSASGQARERLSGYERLLLVGAAIATVAVFAVASLLEPEPREVGTHEQLGLAPCSFRLLTGLPCLSCGMTTSFAYFVRGDFGRALRCHTGATLLAAALVPTPPACLLLAAMGRRSWLRRLSRVGLAIIMVVAGLSLAEWAVRVCLH